MTTVFLHTIALLALWDTSDQHLRAAASRYLSSMTNEANRPCHK